MVCVRRMSYKKCVDVCDGEWRGERRFEFEWPRCADVIGSHIERDLSDNNNELSGCFSPRSLLDIREDYLIKR